MGTPLAVTLWGLFAVVCWLIIPSYAKMSTGSQDVINDVILYGRIVCVFSFGLFLEDGMVSYKEKCIMDVLLREGPTLSRDLKRLAGFSSGGMKGFDMAITHLQMQTYVTVHSFEYARDKHSRPYGWGIARYAVAEDVLGSEVTRGAYSRDSEESRKRIVLHLGTLYPDVFEEDLVKLIR